MKLYDLAVKTISFLKKQAGYGYILLISVHKLCAGASAGAGKVRVRVRRG